MASSSSSRRARSRRCARWTICPIPSSFTLRCAGLSSRQTKATATTELKGRAALPLLNPFGGGDRGTPRSGHVEVGDQGDLRQLGLLRVQPRVLPHHAEEPATEV